MLSATPTFDEKQRLAELTALCILDTEPDPILDRITSMATRLFDVPIALVSLLDERRQWFKSRVGLEATSTPREVSFCGHAIQTPDRQFVVPDATQDGRFVDNPLVTGSPHVIFYAGQPLRGPGGAALGTLCLIDTRPRAWSNQQEQELTALARWVEAEIAMKAIGLADVRGMAGITPGGVKGIERARFWHISRDIFCLADREGRLLDHNGHIARVLGYPAGSMIGRPLLAIVHPDDREVTRAFIERQRDGASPRPFINRIRCAGGAYAFLEWNVAVDDDVTYAIARDVTEREQATRALETINKGLSDSNEDLRKFASFTAHELRSPVRAMANSATLLQRKLEGGDDANVDWAVTLGGAARRLDDMIQSMVALANVNADEKPHDIIDPEMIVQGTMASIQATAPHALVAWPAFSPLYGHAKQLGRLFQELVSNATKYQALDSTPVVDIQARENGDRVVFRIQDNGIGFPSETSEIIFEPLRRLHSRDLYPGTGIGLALCRKIVERHGGSILAQSTGDGSVFTFDLPVATTSGRASPRRARPASAPAR